MDVRARMIELGLSARGLAKAAGVGHSTINTWIKNGYVPDPTKREAVAQLLQVEPEQLRKEMPENTVWLIRQMAVRCISTAQLAAESDVPARAIAQYQRGEREMLPATRCALEQAMHAMSSHESGARRARIDAGITTAELAAELGVSVSEIYNVETHMQPVPVARAETWAQLLGCTPEDLTADAPDPEPAEPEPAGSGVHDGQTSQRDVPDGAWLGTYAPGVAPVLRTADVRQMLVDGRQAGPPRRMHVVGNEAPWALTPGRHTVQLGDWTASWDTGINSDQRPMVAATAAGVDTGGRT